MSSFYHHINEHVNNKCLTFQVEHIETTIKMLLIYSFLRENDTIAVNRLIMSIYSNGFYCVGR